jgi:hypothetical protein
MNRKLFSILGILGLLSAMAGQATANTVSVAGSPVSTNGATSITVLIQGDFTDPTDAGGFDLTWDNSVLLYTGGVPVNPPWDTFFFSEDGALAGGNSVDFFFLGTSGPAVGGAPPANIVPLVEVTFNVIGASGTSSPLALSEACLGCGWSLGIAAIATDYTPGTVDVTAVPLPPSILLFGSALTGFGFVARRRREIEIDSAVAV